MVSKPRQIKPRRVAHWADYAFNDSLEGMRRAKKLGYKWIDLNFHVTRDHSTVCTHWAQPLKHGWYDPLGKITRRGIRVDQMTLEEVLRLRHRRQKKARIQTIRTMFREARLLKIGIEMEAKDSPGFNESTRWVAIKKLADEYEVQWIMKTISNLGSARLRLEAAHAAGVTTMVLPRGSRRIRKTWWACTDYVRGPVIWVT